MASTNWTDLQAKASADFDPVPPDTYEAQIVEAKASQTGDGSKTMFSVKFNVTSGPFLNRKLWNNFTVSPDNPNALGFFFKHMAALGLSKAYFDALPSNEQVAQDLVGRTATLRVEQREWPVGSGTMRNDVKNIMAPQNGAGAPPVAAAGAPPMPGFSAPPPIPQAAPPVAQPPAAPAPIPPPAAVPPVPPPAPMPAVPQPAPVAATPPGMDPAQYQQFLAFQAAQAAAANGGAPATPQPQTPF